MYALKNKEGHWWVHFQWDTESKHSPKVNTVEELLILLNQAKDKLLEGDKIVRLTEDGEEVSVFEFPSIGKALS